MAVAPDWIIAIGGGSVLDTAKAAAVIAANGGNVEGHLRGTLSIERRGIPLIAIPTTSGTGSEVGRSAVITLKNGNRKAILNTPKILPRVALCDPELTLGLPPQITAATGMDALTHNIEAYLSTTYHPPCDAIALGGVRLAAQTWNPP